MALHGKQLSLVVVTYVLCILSFIVVVLRCMARRVILAYGWDDYLMISGLCFFVPTCAFTILGAYNGFGLRDAELNPTKAPRAAEDFFLFQPFYVLTLVCVKSSICVTLLRIAPASRRWLRYYIYGILILSILSSFIAFVALLNVCHPISTAWTGVGKCASPNVIKSIGYFISSTSLVTDFSCAILPSIILWNVQMKVRVKLSVVFILSLGFLASCATIVRLPWIKYYAATENALYHFADLTLWTILECSLGIIAGSVATIKPLLRIFVNTLYQSVQSKDSGESGSRDKSARTAGEVVELV